MLISYGFYERTVITPNSTHGIVPEIPIPPPTVSDDDPLKVEKQALLQLIPSVFHALGWKFNNSIGFAPELLRLYRLLFMDEKDYEPFTAGISGEEGSKEVRGRLSRYVLEGVKSGSSKLSKQNEEKLFDHLYEFCSQSLAAIPESTGLPFISFSLFQFQLLYILCSFDGC